MSPEQARGQTVDKRTDIWSFGCVLYEMLAGRRPFPGQTISETVAGIIGDEPDWTALPPDLPPRVSAARAPVPREGSQTASSRHCGRPHRAGRRAERRRPDLIDRRAKRADD